MRVIAGSKKGHKLIRPSSQKVRPTEDRIKESLFNILGPLNENSIVLDLFAGSGAIGIEFLSRGAKKVYFVDSFNESIKSIKENVSHTKFSEEATILKRDALQAIDFFSLEEIKFDYIYLDPPFKEDVLLHRAIKSIENKKILSDTGILIVEHDIGIKLEDRINNLERIDERKYGKKIITFYKIGGRK